jgi:hypothetical protein
MNLSAFFKRSPTVAEMRITLIKLDVEIQSARERKQQLHDERESIFLDGSDTAVAKHMEAMAQADRSLDMLDVQRRGVSRRIDDAEKKERHDALRRRLDAGRAASDEALDLIATYIEQAGALAGTLRRLQELDEVIADGNRALDNGIYLGVFEPQQQIASPYTRAYQPLSGMDVRFDPSPLPATVRRPDPRNGGPYYDGGPDIWPPMENPVGDQIMAEVAASFGGTIPWSPVKNSIVLEKSLNQPLGVDRVATSA